MPADEHVWTPLPEHCVAPGEHAPEQAPALQAPLAHTTADPHCPVTSHVCTALPWHCVVPGEQTPVQAPLAQA
jgi:hypothetical protein